MTLFRVQKNPHRDAALTAAFHRWLSALQVPPRQVDGVMWNQATHPIDWPGWPRVQMDIRFFKQGKP